MASILKESDFLDVLTITDDNGDPVDITNDIPGFEVWYYTSVGGTVIKFSKESGKSGYNEFVIQDDYTYKAYIESIPFGSGQLKSDTYVATTNVDLSKGNFKNLGTILFDLFIIDRPISTMA